MTERATQATAKLCIFPFFCEIILAFIYKRNLNITIILIVSNTIIYIIIVTCFCWNELFLIMICAVDFYAFISDIVYHFLNAETLNQFMEQSYGNKLVCINYMYLTKFQLHIIDWVNTIFKTISLIKSKQIQLTLWVANINFK